MLSYLQLLEQRWRPFSFIVIAISFTIIYLFKWTPLKIRNKTIPPSPPRLPVIGNLHQLGLHPHRSLQSLAQIHGPIMLLHLGSVPVLVISSAELAVEVMKTHDLAFANRPKTKNRGKLLYEEKDVASAPYGEYWRQLRSICVLHLLSNKRVQSFRHVREEETGFMIDRVKNSCSSSLPVNLTEVFLSLTNDVVCRVALGRKYSPKGVGKKFKQLLAEFNELLGCFDVGDCIQWLGWLGRVNGLRSRVEKVAQGFDDFLERVIEDHDSRGGQGDEEKKDFVDDLLWIQRENMAGSHIDRTGVKAVILDVFAARTDTTQTLIEWAMAEILRHPEVMRKLQNEMRETAKNNKGSSVITENDLTKLHYLKAVIKETLRIHPPVPLLIPRISTQDVKLKGFDIAAGTQVIINAWAIGRDPALWDRSDEFWPERFLNTSVDFKGHDFQFIPFGAGRRICPGIQFAISTAELALSNLLLKFDWSLHGVEKGEDLDISESTGITIHRKFPLLAVATPYF